MNQQDLINKKVIAFRGSFDDILYILFEDFIIMKLYEQDKYDYHDCAQSARHIEFYKCEKTWFSLFENMSAPIQERIIFY